MAKFKAVECKNCKSSQYMLQRNKQFFIFALPNIVLIGIVAMERL